jgi:hypothetical protein
LHLSCRRIEFSQVAQLSVANDCPVACICFLALPDSIGTQDRKSCANVSSSTHSATEPPRQQSGDSAGRTALIEDVRVDRYVPCPSKGGLEQAA